MLNRRLMLAVVVVALLGNVSAYAQVTRDQYERALSIRERYRNLALNIADSPTWVRGAGHRFWYRKSAEGGGIFVMVDAEAGTRAPVFDHEKIAAALSRATGGHYTAVTFPFRSFRYTEGAIGFPLNDARWKSALIKANKKFDLLYVPGGGHGAGGLYGQRLLIDFFVHNLMHAEPPDWNNSPPLPALLRPPIPPGQ